MRRIHVADDPTRAQLIKGVLESEGIPTVVRGDELLWDESVVQGHQRSEIWVREADATRALSILAEIQERIRKQRKWYCWDCNLEQTESFDTCWQCGGARPD